LASALAIFGFCVRNINKKLRIHFPFTSALFFILSSALLISCENKREDIESLFKHKSGVETAKDVTIIYAIGANVKAKITAPLMLRHVDPAPMVEFPQTIHADFLDSTQKVESVLNARYAKYFENESKVFLKDSVVVFNKIGDTLFCQELYWDRRKTGHEFYTDKPVRIRTKSHIIDGDGLDAPQDFKSWHIINGRGIVRVPNTELP